MSRQRCIQVHIETLRLHGAVAGTGASVAAELRESLANLLSEGEMPRRLQVGQSIDVIDPGPVGMTAARDSDAPGRRAAAAIRRGLDQ